MHPILFQWGFVTIHSYGVMVALGFLAGIFLVFFLSGRDSRVLDLAIVVMIASIVGARLFYLVEFWPDFASKPWEIFMVWQGGLVFYGGLILALLAALVFLLKNKMPVWRTLDLAALGTVLGMAIGRLGCFLNGCCYGIETTVPWAVQFPGLLGQRHPTQVYESLDLLLIFAVLFLCCRFKPRPGLIFSLALMLYAFQRFMLEFLRVNPRYLWGLSEAQMVSAVLFLVGIWIFWFRINKSANA